MNTIEYNLTAIREQISATAQQCGRDPADIFLLAVSKTKSVSEIEAALQAGQYAFGENYVQEGVNKVDYFAQSPWARQIQWHFIGALQSNKSRIVAQHFDWLQTLNSARLARRLSEQRPAELAPLNVLIQINISAEKSKSGITLAELDELATLVSALPGLSLRGLMAIPQANHDLQQQFAVFQQMQQAFQALQQRHTSVDTLSMGMSDDMAVAIATGSTMVRIGTAIFGARA